ncbi:META domain-containing protein [Zoogloea sp.]|uniref:META domain-containing protein n=1 Tax=Zoogloea sp. TaxID=49181 RepID=UPI0025F392FB|nr:META domain-containing protein [Zoogloea sp.]MCK6396569.1 META domain-containing protein [Zoogloea sp.]
MRPLLALSLILAAAPALGAGPNPSGPIDGIYIHLADAGMLTDCRSGRRVAVATEADNAALERAYLAGVAQPGAPLWVSLLGHVENRPRLEGGGREDVLVVDRFARVEQSRGCTRQIELNTARWKLVRLEGRPVSAEGIPPFLQFNPEQGRLTGSTGCNRVNGEYRSWGPVGFTVLPLATTRMACPGAPAEQETRFLDALSRATHRIQAGSSLELLANGLPVARFEAEYLH